MVNPVRKFGPGFLYDGVNKKFKMAMESKPRLIMVVDDEDVVREVLCSYLKKKGYETVALPDGQTAISYAKNRKPDLVLLDIKMPGLNGIETCARLRQLSHQSYPNTGIIVITGYDSTENVGKSYSSGAIDVIKKPFDLEDIDQRINAWFEVRNIENNIRRLRTYTEKIGWYIQNKGN